MKFDNRFPSRIMDKDYDYIHYHASGVIGVYNYDENNIVADLHFNKLNVPFIRECMNNYAGKICLCTIPKYNMRSRWLACNLGFRKVGESSRILLYRLDL